ncbi:hypothetical protein V8V91_17825 [Algoriphagus halophilus]|uniref:beta strand repeat-containing protein n=1 Tax=Algoriphagus halophilus TaxID=226505 RepID=UPI00358EC7F5
MIGGTRDTWSAFDGEVAEIILFPFSLTESERISIESYLALKYGISLDPSVTNYLSSDSTIIWDQLNYWNDIFGIGKDDVSGLNQNQSNSINSGSGDGTGQSGKGNLVLSNPSSLDNGDFLLIGHDNGVLTEQSSDLPTSLVGSLRLTREWKVRHTNDVGTVNLTFNTIDLNLSGGQASDFKLLIDTDGDGDFTTGSVTEVNPDSYVSELLTFSSLSLPDNAVFTLLTSLTLADLLQTANLWLKGDQGATQNAGNLSGWVDQTGTNTFTITGSPTFTADAINFNPVVGFNNTSSQTVLPTHRLTGNTEISYVDAFAVFKHNNSLNAGTILGGATAGPNYGKAIFGSSRDFQVYVGNGTNSTYQSFENLEYVNSYTINNLDVSLSTSPFATARLNGDAQPVTTETGGDFSNILLTPMIGGTNNNGSSFGWIPFNGNLAEVITFPSGFTARDKVKIESYLAIKYGIHLIGNYVNSAGTPIWDATTNASYHNDVFGIGSDGVTGLNQTQSNSMNTGSGDGTGQNGKANIVLSNSSSLDPGDFLLIGHDNGALAEQTSELPSGLTNAKRIGREWKVSHTNDVGTVNLSIDLLGISLGGNQANNYRLLVDSDGDGDFTTGTVNEVMPDSFINGVLLFSNIALQDNSVFTLATSLNVTLFQTPNLWLKSDQGVSTNSGNLSRWVDQSFTNNFSVVGDPTVNDSSLNFYPAVTFANPNNIGLPDDGLIGKSQINAVEAFAVFKYDDIFQNGGTIVGNTTGDGGFFERLLTSVKTKDSNGNTQVFSNPNSTIDFAINSIDLSPALANARLNGAPVSVTQESGVDFSSVDLTPVIGGGPNVFRLSGDLTELIIFPNSLSESDKAIIQSYLAIKYGITLDPSVNAYVDSDGNQIWTDTNYWNDVFGIGRDDVSGLNQISSNSVNSGSGNGIGQSGKGNIVISNPSSLDDGDFLMIGHDNGGLVEQTSDLPAGINKFRLGREWKVQRTMAPGTVDLEFDFNGLVTSGGTTNLDNYRMLIDEDGDGDFSTGTVQQIIPDSFGSPKLIFNGVNLPDGAIFTFITGDPNPSWTVTKSTTTQNYDQVRDLIEYEIQVQNTGNVAITALTLTDPNTTLSSTITGDFPVVGTLDVGETWTFYATHRVTQADIDAGSYSNTATVSGIPASGTLAPGISNTVTVNAVQNPSWTLSKEPSRTTYSQVGDATAFRFILTNTGNISISNIDLFDITLSRNPGLVGTSDIGGDRILSVGESWTYLEPYRVTQADIDAGSFVNTATASGTPAGGILSDVSASATITAIQNPSWTLTKSSSTLDFDGVGDVISYQVLLENTGNITVDSPNTSDPLVRNLIKVSGDITNQNELDPGEIWTYTGTYTVNQADLDRGYVENIATANGTTQSAGAMPRITSNPVRVDAVPNPELTVLKTTTDLSYSQLGQALTYRITVRNSGNVTISNVTVTDPGASTGPTFQSGDLGNDQLMSPGETWVYAATHLVNQTDLDAGTYTNTATATGTPTQGTLAPATSSVTVNGVPNPNLNIIKSADKNGYNTAGEVISYTISITNSGNVTLTNLVANDPLAGITNQTIASLAPGQTSSITGTYSVTQADIDGGSITNNVTVTAEDPSGGSITRTDDLRINASQTPRFTIVKTADLSDVSSAGEVITYTILATNTGNITIENVSVTDPLVPALALTGGDVNNNSILNVGEAWTYTGTYTVTQADIDAGQISNTATLSGTPVAGTLADRTTDITIGVNQNPSWTIAKDLTNSNPATYSTLGEVLNYDITVTNTGNVSITSLNLFDLKTAAPVKSSGDNANVGVLDVGEAWIYTATYTVTQADLDAGSFTNSVSATGVSAAGNLPEITASETANAAQTPSWTVTKTASSATFDRAGQTINYSIVLDNTGNVTISNIVPSDPLATSGPTYVSGDTNRDSNLDPTETWTYSATYQIMQDDINAGGFTNTVTVSGTPPTGAIANATDSESITATINRSVNINKTVDKATFDSANTVLNYTIRVTNNGNITLNNLVVNDPKAGIVNQSIGTLQPGASSNLTGTYTVTQADVDNGTVSNTASVTGLAVGGQAVNGNSTVVSTANKNSSINVTKTSTAAGFDRAGQVLSYSIIITNDGNQTLSPVVLTDPLTGLNQTIPTLAPSQSSTIATSYTITQNDVDRGTISNTVTAVGTDPSSATITDTDIVTIQGSKTADFTIAKTVQQSGYSLAGEVLTIQIVIANSGNTRINTIDVTDPLLSTGPTYGSGDDGNSILDVGESWTYTGTYSVTQADVDSGTITNTGTVTGLDPDGNTISKTDTDIVTGSKNPDLSLTKSVSPATFNNVGDVITYTFTVTNLGNVTLSDVTISDPLLSLNTDIGSLAPNQTISITENYTITQADLDRGEIVNTARAVGQDPDGNDIDDSDTVVSGGNPRPSIDVEKTVSAFGYSIEGEIIQYILTVKNNGNVNLDNAEVQDSKLGFNQAIGSLAPGQVEVYTVDYSVTQQDVDLGRIENLAEASGVETSLGVTVRDFDSNILNGSQNPKIELTKTVQESGFTTAGEILNYTITVTNTGNVTLNSVQVQDPTTGLAVNINTMAPKQIETYTTVYTVTQDDLNQGFVENTASTSARGTRGEPVSDSETIKLAGSNNPNLVFTKTATPASVSALGEVIRYQLTVNNTGNISYLNVVVQDPLSSLSENISRLDPGVSQAYTAAYTVTQVDLDRGFVENNATLTADLIQQASPVSLTQTVRTPVAQSPSLRVRKTADISSFDAPSTTINYTIAVENTGNVSITNLAVNDPQTAAPSYQSGDTNADGIVSPGEIWTYTASYVTNQDDVDNGGFRNTATARGDPAGGTLSPANGSVNVPSNIRANWTIEKTAQNNPKEYSFVGEVITYEIVLTNTGNASINTITINDPGADSIPTLNAGSDVGNDGILSIGEAWTYTATHAVTQADLDNGTYVNAAAASGLLTSGLISSVADTEIVTAVQSPSWTLVKTSTTSPNNYNALGQALTYNLALTNTGNVTFAGVNVTDPGVNNSPPTFRGGDTNNNNLLDVGEVWNYTASHTTNQADIDAGQFVNVATATGFPSGGALASTTGTATVTAVTNSVLVVEKTVAQNGYFRVGEVLNYTVTVRNTGNTTLNNVHVEDVKTGLSQTITVFAPGDSRTYNLNYTVTQNDIDRGTITNTATAAGQTALGDPVSGQATDVINGSQTPGLNITKGVRQSGYINAGEVVDYSIYVQNPGNINIFNLRVEDAKVGLDTTLTVLAPGAFATFDVNYTITQADVDAGSVVNVVSATGADFSGNVLSDTDSKNLFATQNPKMVVSKSASTVNYDAVGDVISYNISIRNRGNVTLSNVLVIDPDAVITSTNPVAAIAPGQEVILNAQHVVTQADLDAGSYSNRAEVEAREPNNAGTIKRQTNTVVVPAVQKPDFTVVKNSLTTEYDTATNVINYEIIVTNIGNVTLSDIVVSDPKAIINSGSPISTLAPGAVATVTASHTVVLGDVNAGEYRNTATGKAKDPNNKEHTRNSSQVIVPAIQKPALEISKSSTQTTYSSVGEVISYSMVIRNTGNVTVRRIQVTDPNTTISQSQFQLRPDQQRTVTATHIVTQADLDAGQYVNTASVSGIDPKNNAVNAVSNSVTLTADQTPGLAATKVSQTQNYASVGENINYIIEVENTGNVTLSNIVVTDPNVDILSGNPIASLAPGAKRQVSVRHIVEQADLDAGSYSNQATANGVDVNNDPIAATTNEVVVQATQAPSITLTKNADKASYSQVGEVITFDLSIENQGNVTLSSVQVTDALTGFTSPSITLNSNQTEVYTTTYTVTQADIDNGSIDNTATVNGVDTNNNPVSDNDQISITASQDGNISITKDANKAIVYSAGESITYTINVTNIGNVTLSNVRTQDNKLGFDNTESSDLDPGASVSYTLTYTVTQSDIDAGEILNTAEVTADTPAAKQITDSDDQKVGVDQQRKVSIEKVGDLKTYFRVGQDINYNVIVRNEGNVTLTNVNVTDPKTGLNETLTLDPGQVQTYTTAHTIDQSDIDSGIYENTASVTANAPLGQLLSDSNTWTANAAQFGSLEIRKIVSPRIYQNENDVVTYTIFVTNRGNVTLTNVQTTDPTLSYSQTEAALDPQQSVTYTIPYSVTQSDVDAGLIRNTATVTAVQPDNSTITRSDVAFAISLGRGAIDLAKTALSNSYTNVGDAIDYELTVTNIGSLTLENIQLSDAPTGLNPATFTLTPEPHKYLQLPMWWIKQI